MSLVRRFGIALAVGILAGCTTAPETSIDPSALPGAPVELTFDGRSNPPVVLRINGIDVARIPCLQGATHAFAPGVDGVPELPWDLQVLRERDGKVLVDERVSSLPKWLLMFQDGSGGIGSSPALGPVSPTCAPA